MWRGRSAKRPVAETVEIRTEDAVSLRATLREPRRARGTMLLAHALCARRSTFDAGLAEFLNAEGWRTLAFDFRGHGESGTPAADGGQWSYDDLVMRDLPAVASSARARWKGPLVVVGHSLGGHVALAAQGTGAIDGDGICAVSSNVWLPQYEPSLVRWQAKRAAAELLLALVRTRGYLPARQMHLGTDDESAACMSALVRGVKTGGWCSDDGERDYERGLGKVRVPVLAIATTADRLNCVPEAAERMLARCAGSKEFRLVARDDEARQAPDAMALVTGPSSKHVWRAIAEFAAQIHARP